MNIRMIRLLAVLVVGLVSGRATAWTPDLTLPSVALMELAEQAHSRALTAAEFDQVMSNELTAYVYLEAALRQSAAGVEYRLPATAPKGCLVAPMYALLKKKAGGLTAEELTDVAKRFPFHAWYAFKLGFGSESETINGLARRSLSSLRHGAIAKYVDALAREPAGVAAKVEHHVRALEAHNDLMVARMIELGAPARDAMVARLDALPIPSEHDAGGKYLYGKFFLSTALVLAAANDNRLSSSGIFKPERLAVLPASEVERLSAIGDPRLTYHRANRLWWHACVYGRPR